MIAFIAKRFGGPVLVYAVLALFVSNVATGYLLKRNYDAKVTARLECNNDKLAEALQANEAVRQAMFRFAQERDEERAQRIEATRTADENATARVAAMRSEHATELEILRAEIAAIPEPEIDCASRPVSAGILDRMREQARSYNADRNSRTGARDSAPD